MADNTEEGWERKCVLCRRQLEEFNYWTEREGIKVEENDGQGILKGSMRKEGGILSTFQSGRGCQHSREGGRVRGDIFRTTGLWDSVKDSETE